MSSLNKSVVVSGEASETDSEEETVSSLHSSPVKPITPIQGAVIAGEDSESENENDASISSAVSVLDHPLNSQKETESANKYGTLLHQKLRECNTQLKADVEAYCDNVINEASKTLSTVDQQLLKSQIVLQGALPSMRSLSSNSFSLRSKLQSLLSSKFFFNVKVEDK